VFAADQFASVGEASPPSLVPDQFASFDGTGPHSPEPVAGTSDVEPAPSSADPFAAFADPGVATLAPDPAVAVKVEDAGQTSFAEPHVASVVVDAMFDAAVGVSAFASEAAVPETDAATMQEPLPSEQNVLDELEAWLAAIKR